MGSQVGRTRGIIGVFGGKDPVAVVHAKVLGALLAARGQIVLTGGERAGTGSVKESSIAGAGQSPWIGVLRSGPVDCRLSKNGFLICSGLGHKRNYLEAALCDAVICLRGQRGTISELLFSLALSRPAAVVGDGLNLEWNVNDPQQLEVMLERAFDRVGTDPTGNAEFDRLFNEPAIRRDLAGRKLCGFFQSCNLGLAVDWVLNMLDGQTLKGNLPLLTGFEEVQKRFDEWLQQL
jgi:hypothetical protein